MTLLTGNGRATGLLALHQAAQQGRKPDRHRDRGHHDDGMGIDLRYHSSSGQPAAQALAFSPQADLSSGLADGPEVVQAFGDPAGDLADLGAGSTSQLSADSGSSGGATADAEAGSPPAAPSGPAPIIINVQQPAPPPPPPPPPAEEAEALHRDIAAALSALTGETSDRLPLGEQVGEDGAPSEPSHLAQDRHAIFDHIGRSMSLATQYDMGSVPLSRFDEFDAQLSTPTITAMDIMEDLDFLSRAKDATSTESADEGPESSSAAISSDGGGWVPSGAALEGQGGEVSAAQGQPNASFDVRCDVPLIPQRTGMSCWAAGCAMVVAWRDGPMSVDPAQIAAGSGHWAQYSSGLLPEDTDVFRTWRLDWEAGQSHTVESFRQLLEDFGPIWVAGYSGPGVHVRVITGMWGDGSPSGTTVRINDPWQTGMTSFAMPNTGSTYEQPYAQFVQEMEALVRRELKQQGIYIAHSTRADASRRIQGAGR